MASDDSAFSWMDNFPDDGSNLSEPHVYDAATLRRLQDAQELELFPQRSVLPTRPDQAMDNHNSPSQPHAGQSDSVSGRGFGSYAHSHQIGFGDLPASDGFLRGQDQTPQSFPQTQWDIFNANSIGGIENEGFNVTVSTSAASSSGAASTPAQSSMNSSPPFLPMLAPTADKENRKRTRDATFTSPQDQTRFSKSMRVTPSPAATQSTSPGSFDDHEYGDLSDFFGSNIEKEMREMQEYEKEMQQEAKAREEQERRDWEMAQQLQNDLNSGSDSFSPSQTWSNDPSQRAGGNTIQSYLDGSGKIRRLLPPASKTPSRSTKPDAAAGPSSYNRTLYPRTAPGASNHSLTKAESSRSRDSAQTSSNQDRNGYIDLQDDSDSDVQIVEPDAFMLSRQRPNSNFKKEPPGDSGANWTQDANEFGNLGDIPIMDLTHSSPVQQHGSIKMAGGWPMSEALTSGHNVQGLGGANVYGNDSGDATLTSSLFDPIRQGISSAAAAAYDMVDRTLGGVHVGSSYPNYGPGASLLPSGLPQQSYSMLGSRAHPVDLNDLTSEYGQGFDSALERMNTSNTTEDLKDLMNNIRPDEDLGADDRTGSPEDMADGAALYPHQKLGLAWMVKMEGGSNKGGILADDMGLGKTIQAIALMVSRRSDNPAKKTTLIVAPVALLKQWESEIKIKVRPEKRLSTYIYHGKGKTITWDKLRHYDVVLTTYGTLASESKRKERIEMIKKTNPNWRPAAGSDHLPVLGDECRFFRVVLDEAQNVKNKSTKSAKAVHQIQASTRFCMTGTPMMNHVVELYSLIHFLRIRPYCEWERFNHDFARPLKTNSDYLTSRAMQKFRALLKAILLRRTKKSTINGEPIINLGPRVTEVCHAEFDEDQRGYYQATEKGYQLQFNKYFRAGTVNKNYTNVLVLLLRLRQLCCHPHLIQDFDEGEGCNDMSPDVLLKIAREGLAQDVIDRIIERGIGECPICMDAANNARIFTPCGHSTCSECFAKISDSSRIAEDEAEGRSFKCMECRGRVEPNKVTDYDSFKKVYMPEAFPSEEMAQDDGDQDGDSTSDSDSDSDSDLESEGGSEGSLADFIVDDDEVEHMNGTEDDADDLDVKSLVKSQMSRSRAKGKDRAGASDEEATQGWGKSRRSSKDSKTKRSKKSEPKSESRGKGKGKEKKTRKGPKKTLAQLKKESHRSEKARRKYLKHLRKDWISSAKIDRCLEILGKILEKEDNEKTIVFSQFTTLLDLLEIPMVERGWTYKRYDGSMSANARNDAVLEFSSRRNCRVMLISLKAGNSGLNLTCANNVILFDPFWNPYIEEQAVDRAHRIGQRRDVFVHRILVPETVEDRIVALQERKRELIEGALDETASKSIGRLGVRELAFLFGVSAQ